MFFIYYGRGLYVVIMMDGCGLWEERGALLTLLLPVHISIIITRRYSTRVHPTITIFERLKPRFLFSLIFASNACVLVVCEQHVNAIYDQTWFFLLALI
ncbi:hypothetical protein B0F90DRAFT_360264 [Multifurca ochricompacta]|uniref:Uncharacterized protein n=1 Tax=Multifurca ochricompacta TaxID=376703 RepID=A0AAD4M4E1_9AGAM|nr:hypothetical protein B0F90DRAFT_360264 [Multifurca ochricompacta]